MLLRMTRINMYLNLKKLDKRLMVCLEITKRVILWLVLPLLHNSTGAFFVCVKALGNDLRTN